MDKSIVRMNAEENPNYNPYCMRCVRLVRMQPVGYMRWKCRCGASHDERTPEEKQHSECKQ